MAIVRRRLILEDGFPVELADSYYPAAIAVGTQLAEPKKVPGGTVTLLAGLGYSMDVIDEDVSARPATDEERDLLNLGEHEWVLVLARSGRTAEGTPFEVSVMTMVARDRHLHYRMSTS